MLQYRWNGSFQLQNAANCKENVQKSRSKQKSRNGKNTIPKTIPDPFTIQPRQPVVLCISRWPQLLPFTPSLEMLPFTPSLERTPRALMHFGICFLTFWKVGHTDLAESCLSKTSLERCSSRVLNIMSVIWWICKGFLFTEPLSWSAFKLIPLPNLQNLFFGNYVGFPYVCISMTHWLRARAIVPSVSTPQGFMTSTFGVFLIPPWKSKARGPGSGAVER